MYPSPACSLKTTMSPRSRWRSLRDVFMDDHGIAALQAFQVFCSSGRGQGGLRVDSRTDAGFNGGAQSNRCVAGSEHGSEQSFLTVCRFWFSPAKEKLHG